MRHAPAGWSLVVVTSGFALLSVIVYLMTGEFSQAWLAASAVVYGMVVVGAVVLAAIDRGAPPPAQGAASGPLTGDPALLAREVVYRTATGEALRLTYRWPDGTEERRHVAATIGEMHTHPDIATYIDALPPAIEGADITEAVERALDARGIPTRTEVTA